MERRSRAILLAAGVVWTALAGCIAYRLRELAVDDFFVTYRYAWNLLHGQGFVFNLGERVYGLTDPGFGLLLAGAAFLTRFSIPTLGTFLTGLALAGVALALLDEALRQPAGRHAPEAILGGTLAVLSSCLWVNQGAGVFWALLLLLLAARLGARFPVAAGTLAGLALWMRPDAALGVAALLAILWIEERRIPWRLALAAGLVALCGVAATWGYFGSPLPNTLAAKHGIAAGSGYRWAGLGRFWARLAPILPRHWGAAWRWVALAGGLGHLPLWLRSGRAGRSLAAYSLALAVAYPLLGVPFSFWYVAPVFAGALYGLAYLGGWVGSALGGRVRRAERGEPVWRSPLSGGIALLVLLPLLASLLPANLNWLRNANWQRHLETYRAAALWLRDHSDEKDDLAYVEIGVWGYYSRRTVIDLLGLVTPSSIPFAQAGDRVGAFLARPTRWVVFHSRGEMAPILNARWFPRSYEEVVRFDEGGGKELVLYRRFPDGRIPPARAPRPARPAGPAGPAGPENAGRLDPAPPPSPTRAPKP